ncbi:MAG: FtsX-like permease family protein [Planctomycetota bacterium]
MNVWHLVKREIAHRKLNFALGALSVAVAAACLVAQFTLLRAHDIRTSQLLDEKERRVDERLKKLKNEYRKLTLKAAFNVRILPEGQSLGDFYAAGFADKTMDEELAHRLAGSDILTTVRHILPKLERKIDWPERSRKIILLGTRGEIPLKERTRRKPPVYTIIPEGQVDVGHELRQTLKLKPGDEVTLLGEKFVVRKCHDERGTRADITVWVDLTKAQKLLGLAGRINEIQAVDCTCAGSNIVAIRAEIGKILPGTEVIIDANRAFQRWQSRFKAEDEHKAAIADERAGRNRLREERKAFAAILVPLVVVVCGLWIGLLAFGNVRERSPEIGILRAIGLQARQIFAVFMGRALLIGIIGACIGYPAGFAVGAVWGKAGRLAIAGLFSPILLVSVIVTAPLLAVLATWLPALAATRQDPALVLREK